MKYLEDSVMFRRAGWLASVLVGFGALAWLHIAETGGAWALIVQVSAFLLVLGAVVFKAVTDGIVVANWELREIRAKEGKKENAN